jgi:type I restriction enzyme, R subunit
VAEAHHQQGAAAGSGESVDSSAASRRIRPAGCLSAVCLASRQSARLKDAKNPFKIVIVRDMWLTGFDAPCLHTMYADKPMQGHGLMHAIARVPILTLKQIPAPSVP